MRASSLSNGRVIELLSRYFVPVLLSRDDYENANADPADAEEARKVLQSAAKRGMSHGNVNAYVLTPDGTPIASLIVSKAEEPEGLVPLLQQVVDERRLEPRDPDAVRATAANLKVTPPLKHPDGLRLHIWVRYLGGDAELGVADDWLELTTAEMAAFCPPANARPADQWAISDAVTRQLYARFYPALCEYAAKATSIRASGLEAKLVSSAGETATVALHGYLEADHSRDGNVDGRILASLTGFATCDSARGVLTSLQMASDKAAFVWHWKGKRNAKPFISIAVESVPSRR